MRLPWYLMRDDRDLDLAAARQLAEERDRVAGELRARVDQLEHERDRTLALLESAQRTLDKFGDMAEHAMSDVRRERGRIDDLLEQLAREHAAALEAVRSLSADFAKQLAELRRDGFNPIPTQLAPGWSAGTVPELGPIARQALGADPAPAGPEGLDTEGRVVTWENIVEAAQDRANGNGNLYNRLIGDAETWRQAKIPLAEIERRIWSGTGG